MAQGDITFGSEYVYGKIQGQDITYLDSTHFVLVFRDYANSNYFRAKIGVIAGDGSISYGSTYSVISAIGNVGSVNSITTIDSTHFIVTYTNTNIYAKHATVSNGTEISFGAECTVATRYDSYSYVNLNSICSVSSTKFIIAYTDFRKNSYGDIAGIKFYIRTLTLSGTNLTSNSPYSFSSYGYISDSTINQNFDVAVLSESSFIVAYPQITTINESGTGYARIGIISGTGISYGTVYSFASSSFSVWRYIKLAKLTSSKVVISYSRVIDSSLPKAIVANISSGVISFGSIYEFYGSSTLWTDIDRVDDTHAIQIYLNSSNYPAVKLITESSNELTFGSETLISAAISNSPRIVCYDTNKFLAAYANNTSYDGRVRVGSIEGVSTFEYTTSGSFELSSTSTYNYELPIYEYETNGSFELSSTILSTIDQSYSSEGLITLDSISTHDKVIDTMGSIALDSISLSTIDHDKVSDSSIQLSSDRVLDWTSDWSIESSGELVLTSESTVVEEENRITSGSLSLESTIDIDWTSDHTLSSDSSIQLSSVNVNTLDIEINSDSFVELDSSSLSTIDQSYSSEGSLSLDSTSFYDRDIEINSIGSIVLESTILSTIDQNKVSSGSLELDSDLDTEVTREIVTSGSIRLDLERSSSRINMSDIINFGDISEYNSSTFYPSLALIDSTHFVLTYRDSDDSNKGKAIIGTISNSDEITFGSEYVFHNAVTQQTSVSLIDSTHFVVTYQDQTNTDKGTACIGTINNGVITFGAEYLFNNARTYDTSVALLDSTHFVVTYCNVDNSYRAIARIGTVSNENQISFGSEYQISIGAGAEVLPVKVDSTHFVVAYREGYSTNYGRARFGTVSNGNQISFGTYSEFYNQEIFYLDLALLDSTHFAVAGYKYSGGGSAWIGTISGTSISFGSAYNYDSNGAFPSIIPTSSTSFIIAYGNSNGGLTAKATVSSGNVITYESTRYSYSNMIAAYNEAVPIDSTHFVLSWTDNSFPAASKAIIGTLEHAATTSLYSVPRSSYLSLSSDYDKYYNGYLSLDSTSIIDWSTIWDYSSNSNISLSSESIYDKTLDINTTSSISLSSTISTEIDIESTFEGSISISSTSLIEIERDFISDSSIELDSIKEVNWTADWTLSSNPDLSISSESLIQEEESFITSGSISLYSTLSTDINREIISESSISLDSASISTIDREIISSGEIELSSITSYNYQFAFNCLSEGSFDLDSESLIDYSYNWSIISDSNLTLSSTMSNAFDYEIVSDSNLTLSSSRLFDFLTNWEFNNEGILSLDSISSYNSADSKSYSSSGAFELASEVVYDFAVALDFITHGDINIDSFAESLWTAIFNKTTSGTFSLSSTSEYYKREIRPFWEYTSTGALIISSVSKHSIGDNVQLVYFKTPITTNKNLFTKIDNTAIISTEITNQVEIRTRMLDDIYEENKE